MTNYCKNFHLARFELTTSKLWVSYPNPLSGTKILSLKTTVLLTKGQFALMSLIFFQVSIVLHGQSIKPERWNKRCWKSPSYHCSIVKLSKDRVSDERYDSGYDWQQGERFADVVVVDAFGHQRPEERKFAASDGAEGLAQVELPEGLKQYRHWLS